MSINFQASDLHHTTIFQAGAGGGDTAKVKEELERKLLETRMLYTTTIDDYTIVSVTQSMPRNKCYDNLCCVVSCSLV